METLSRNFRRRRGSVLGCLLFAIILLVIATYVFGATQAFAAFSATAVGMGLLMKDALLKVTKALPAGASAVYSDAIDLGHGSRGDWLATIEFLLTAPALTTGQLADGSKITYDIVSADTSDLSSGTAIVYPGVIVQTGASSAGATGSDKTVRLPIDVKRYVGFKATKTGSESAAAKSGTFEALC